MYIIYGAQHCGYCAKAKQFLDTHKKEYVYHDITGKKTAAMDALAPRTNNQRTVPIIFDNDKFIGGFKELRNVVLFELSEDF